MSEEKKPDSNILAIKALFCAVADIKENLREALVGEAISLEQLFIMNDLRDNGKLTPSKIAKNNPGTNISYSLSELKKKGYIFDAAANDDRRTKFMALTEEGKEALKFADEALAGMHIDIKDFTMTNNGMTEDLPARARLRQLGIVGAS